MSLTTTFYAPWDCRDCIVNAVCDGTLRHDKDPGLRVQFSEHVPWGRETVVDGHWKGWTTVRFTFHWAPAPQTVYHL